MTKHHVCQFFCVEAFSFLLCFGICSILLLFNDKFISKLMLCLFVIAIVLRE